MNRIRAVFLLAMLVLCACVGASTQASNAPPLSHQLALQPTPTPGPTPIPQPKNRMLFNEERVGIYTNALPVFKIKSRIQSQTCKDAARTHWQIIEGEYNPETSFYSLNLQPGDYCLWVTFDSAELFDPNRATFPGDFAAGSGHGTPISMIQDAKDLPTLEFSQFIHMTSPVNNQSMVSRQEPFIHSPIKAVWNPIAQASTYRVSVRTCKERECANAPVIFTQRVTSNAPLELEINLSLSNEGESYFLTVSAFNSKNKQVGRSSFNTTGRGWSDGFFFRVGETRKIIFVDGIDTESLNDCGDPNKIGFINAQGENGIQWIADALTTNEEVKKKVSIDPDKDFLYFSYRWLHGYCETPDGKNDYRMPKYEKADTCNGVDDSFLSGISQLNSMIMDLAREDEHVRFDFVAHSMGGLVVARWLIARPDLQGRVNSVTTFDSPLRGVPTANPVSVCVPPLQSSDPSVSFVTDSWKDLLCEDYAFPNDRDKCMSEVVGAIAEIGKAVPFFTMDAIQEDIPLIQAVPANRTTLLHSRSSLHCQFDDNHGTIWDRKETNGSTVNCWIQKANPKGDPDFQISKPSEYTKSIENSTLKCNFCKIQLYEQTKVARTISSPRSV